jgi:hypothetical protein
MLSAHAILVLDDGELGPVCRVLEELGADFVHLSGDAIPESLQKPRDVLVTSWKRALELPEFHGGYEGCSDDPAWVCVHDLDLLPLRDRLRTIGVDFLVDLGVDLDALRLLFLQLLHQGAEKRQDPRLPVTQRATYWCSGEERDAELVEVSSKGARILVNEMLTGEEPIALSLPEELDEGPRVCLEARVLRCEMVASEPGGPGYSLALEWTDLDGPAESLIDKLLSGRVLGTRVTRLNAPEPQAQQTDVERRSGERWEYRSPVRAVTSVTNVSPHVILGHDLSLEGIRLSHHPSLELGARVALALRGGSGAEPIVLEARVVRHAGREGVGLEFLELGDEQQSRLMQLISELKPIECLRDGSYHDAILVERLGDTRG